MMKLALGTAQFGFDYGVSNQHGQVPKEQVKAILQKAVELGINTLDCAAVYGNSEKILGELLNQLPFKKNANIITKIPALTDTDTPETINNYFHKSLENLGKDNVDGVLFHQANNLITHPEKDNFYAKVQTLKAMSLVNKIGVSVYTPAQLISICRCYKLDIAQVPVNVFDQRFLTPNMLELYQHHQIKLHTRSIFLQGLLLMEVDTMPCYFAPFHEKLSAFSQLAEYLSCSKLCLALAIVMNNANNYSGLIEHIIIGICNVQQLTQVVNAYQQAKELPLNGKELNELADTRIKLINPSLWTI